MRRARATAERAPIRTGVTGDLTAAQRAAALVLFFASGFAGLVYEVLWMKELGLVFGNTAQAAATTLAAFFLGLVAGARYWGNRTGEVASPLRAYALLEAGVALSALLYFLLLDTYHALYSPLFHLVARQPVLFLAAKFLLAVGVLFPPSFFMGGTLPMMSQHLIRRTGALGRLGSLLYAINTVGATCGAWAAGFYLPRQFGFTNSYLFAIGLTSVVAGFAWVLGGYVSLQPRGSEEPATGRATETPLPVLAPRSLRALAFFSGFATLGLEVLWTRMFAQVLQNSVYSFSTILVTFLVALALGAALASWLIRQRYDPNLVLPGLLVASGVLVAATPFVFYGMTDGLTYFGGQSSFGGYVLGSFWCAAVVMLLPGTLLGVLLPYLLRLAEPFAQTVGKTIGDLAAINTVGAVLGSVVAGFVLLDVFGLWSSIRLIAVAYVCAALLVGDGMGLRGTLRGSLVIGGLVLVLSILDPSRLPVVKVDPIEKGESLLRVWESSAGIVSVIRQPTSLNIKLDNDYSLGGTGAALYEEAQTHLPLLLHPKPDSVFFLGLGTGITAGASLAHPVKRVVVSELHPKVVEAARSFFTPYVHNLFDDPRVTVTAQDGRNYLFGTSERFDVIIADLFMPWKAGVGSLYSREHYESAKRRLRDGGFYVQWLPLYQLSRDEFGIVARTMRDVFPLVTLWRGTIAPGWETIALIGHEQSSSLQSEAVLGRLAARGQIAFGKAPREADEPPDDAGEQRLALKDILLQYCGNLSAAGRILDRYPLNTDDRPVIEYEAPVTHRRRQASETSWFVGRELVEFLGNLMVAAPPDSDPYLSGLTASELGFVRAGLSLYVAQVFERAGDQAGARKAMQEFDRLYSPADTSAGSAKSELEQARDELNQLIETYEERIRGLREHLRELNEEVAPERQASSSSRRASGQKE